MADRGDHPRSRARLSGAGRTRRSAVLEGRGSGAAVRARGEDRSRLARDRRAERREGAREPRQRLSPRPTRREEPAHVSPRPGGGERWRRPLRPDDRDRALPGRDRRLASLHPDPVRRPGARAVGDGARRAAARLARARGAVDLVGRRHRLPSPRGRSAAADRGSAPDTRGDRGSRRPGARADGAVRCTVPRECRARAADPEAPPRPADAALAAAPQGPEPAPGGAQLRLVPDRPRDVSGVPAGRLRPACAEGDPARAPDPRARSRRGRDGLGVAVRLVAALRVRGDLHVRGRHACGRAARAGTLARPRPSPGAPRAGGAPRSPRSGGARRRRGATRRRSALSGRAARSPAPPRRSRGRRGRRGARGDPRDRASRAARSDCGGGAADRDRGCGPVPRRARRDAARRPARGVSRPGA